MFFAEIKNKKDEIFVKRKDKKDFASQIYWVIDLFLYLPKFQDSFSVQTF